MPAEFVHDDELTVQDVIDWIEVGDLPDAKQKQFEEEMQFEQTDLNVLRLIFPQSGVFFELTIRKE